MSIKNIINSKIPIKLFYLTIYKVSAEFLWQFINLF